MRKGKGKSNPLLLRIAKSGGNARLRESSPLSGVGGVSGLGPGKCSKAETYNRNSKWPGAVTLVSISVKSN